MTAVQRVARKPAYVVPSMAEISAQRHNGFRVASAFSGCGGSSLGYRMAGFRVLWASEFVPAAADTYRANAAPGTVVDTRDIREVTAAQLCEAAGVAPGELDIFDGSPPCASFSTVGKLDAGWGAVRKYSDTRQRTDDLFFEFARLIDGVRPRVFVAENVSGLVKGPAKGYFKLVLKALRDCGYTVSARLLDASWLGVPQARQRLIFIGVRADLGVPPVFPRPLPYQYSVADALPSFAGRATRLINDTGGYFGMGDVTDRPCPTFCVEGTKFLVDDAGGSPIERDPETGHGMSTTVTRDCRTRRGGVYQYRGSVRWLTLGESRALSGFPADFVLTGTHWQRWERLARAVPPVMMNHIAGTVRDEILLPLRAKGVI